MDFFFVCIEKYPNLFFELRDSSMARKHYEIKWFFTVMANKKLTSKNILV